MRYAVDKIDGKIATLESIEDGSKIYTSLINIPFEIKESDILLYDGKSYLKDDEFKNDRLKKILEKMEKLKNEPKKWFFLAVLRHFT